MRNGHRRPWRQRTHVQRPLLRSEMTGCVLDQAGRRWNARVAEVMNSLTPPLPARPSLVSSAACCGTHGAVLSIDNGGSIDGGSVPWISASNAADVTFKHSDTAFRNTTVIVKPGIRCSSTITDGSHGDELIEDCRDFLVVQLRQPISVESRPRTGVAKRRRDDS